MITLVFSVNVMVSETQVCRIACTSSTFIRGDKHCSCSSNSLRWPFYLCEMTFGAGFIDTYLLRAYSISFDMLKKYEVSKVIEVGVVVVGFSGSGFPVYVCVEPGSQK